MERTISPEERIRKAEEIYNRRRQENNRVYREKNNRSEIKYQEPTIKRKIIKKIIVQMLVCLCLYLTLYGINSNNIGFSEDLDKKMESLLAYDISFENIYSNIKKYIEDENNVINKFLRIDDNNQVETKTEEEDENNLQENINEAGIENIIQEDELNNTEAIGGIVEETIEESKSQEELDVEYVKNNCSIIWPLNGTITSRFGAREATEIVSANHYGLDIGGNTGADIISAMNGVVTLASAEGDYGKHIKIENNNISTIYAHCSKLCVSEGEQITQGQKIAEVGSTGRATGPHLHFEIRVEDRKINPELILE